MKGNPAMVTQCSQLQGEAGAHSRAGGQDFSENCQMAKRNLIASLMPFYSRDMIYGLGEHRVSNAVVHAS